jgi:putative NADPH-quinone reductase
MMTISLILAHPHSSSFNHAIAAAACDALREAGHQVNFHDLYAEGFDPLLPAGEIASSASVGGLVGWHCSEIAQADGIVIVHPNWWGMPPAVLKGWIDRVLRPGVAYRFDEGDSGEGVPVGLLRAKTAVVLNTSNTLPERERQVFGDPLDTIWRNCIFGLCGVKDVRRKVFGAIVTSTPEQRGLWLQEARVMVLEALAGS